MFEEEAELHSKEWFRENVNNSTYETPFTERHCYELGFQNGAKFGYNTCFEQIKKLVNEHTRLDCIIPELLRLQKQNNS